MQRLHVLSDGQIIAEAGQQLPPAALYGYTVFTTFRAPIEEDLLQLHLNRLKANAVALNFGLPPAFEDESALKAWLMSHHDKTVLRLTLIPTNMQLQPFSNPEPLVCELWLHTRPVPEIKQGLRLKSVWYEPVLPQIKHGALMERFAMRNRAQQEGYDDVLWMNRAGQWTESTTANIFFIRNGTLITPHPDRNGCLGGITRQCILSFAHQVRITAEEGSLERADLSMMEGAFLSNSVQRIVQIKQIDNHLFPWPSEARSILARLHSGLA